jgi:cell division protein FtsB
VFTKYGSFSPKQENFPLSDEAKATFTEKIEQANGEVTVKTENETMQERWRERISSYLSRSGRRVATAVAIVIAVSLGYHVTFGANGLSAYQQKRNQHQTLQKEILQLQQENSRLQDHVQHLQSDPNAIEHEARVILRYAKPGEVIYALNDKPESKQPSK